METRRQSGNGALPPLDAAGVCTVCPYRLTNPPLQVADLTLDVKRRRATRAGQRIDLSPRESDLLELLMRHPGQLCSRERILKEAWGFEFDPGTNIVEKNMNRLRAKLDAGFPTTLIQTVRCEGYKLVG